MKQTSIYRLILPVVVLLLGASCSDWTETENIDNTVLKPWEQDPALWADYTAALRAYKVCKGHQAPFPEFRPILRAGSGNRGPCKLKKVYHGMQTD